MPLRFHSGREGLGELGLALAYIVIKWTAAHTYSWQYRYDNWVAALVDWREVEHSQEWHDWVQKAFEAFDADGSGSIGIQDLQDMLCQGGICAVSLYIYFLQC